MKACILARVSTHHQTDNHSLDGQVRMCRDFCERHNMEVQSVHREVGSGGALERPVLDAVLDECASTGAVLVVKSLSRLSRRVALVATLLEKGVRFHIVELGYRELSAFEVHLWSAFSAMEREAIKVRVNQGIAEAKRKGVRFGNPRHHEARAIANKVRAANSERYIARTMVAIREIQSTGITTQSGIARCLNARGMRTSRGKAFTQPLVRYVMMKAQDTRG